MNAATMEGVGKPTPFPFKLIPVHKPEQLLANVRYAMTLGLPEVNQCAAHDKILSIAGGGPSLGDTWPELSGYVAAVNGSLSYLLGKGITPQFCGICDPTEKIADIVEANENVSYLVASCAHPKVFQKLLTANCKVLLWHHAPMDGLDALLNQYYPDGWTQIPGGCAMGIHWLTLGYHMGFRKFHCHGLDSSFRGKSSHAYPDHQDHKNDWVTFDGFTTRINFLGQVEDFIGLMEDSRMPNVEPTEIKMFGEGLLQTRYAYWQYVNPPFEWPESDTLFRIHSPLEAKTIPAFLDFIPKRDVCVQAGGNVGVYPRKLADFFNYVITFEPNAENYRLLCNNTLKRKNIDARFAALGEMYGHASTKCHQDGNTGALHLVPGDDVPVIPLDGLNLDHCDLIWLDVEGYEEPALKGAAGTIEKFHPAIIIEEKSLHADAPLAELHGLDPTGAIKWLKARQYYRVTRINNDCLWIYGGE